MHTAPYAPEAVCIQIMLLEHIWLNIFSRLLMVQDHLPLDHMVQLLDHIVQEQLVLDHKSRPKCQKSSLFSFCVVTVPSRQNRSFAVKIQIQICYLVLTTDVSPTYIFKGEH